MNYQKFVAWMLALRVQEEDFIYISLYYSMYMLYLVCAHTRASEKLKLCMPLSAHLPSVNNFKGPLVAACDLVCFLVCFQAVLV